MLIRPTRALVALLILWTLLGLAGSLWSPASQWWAWFGVGLVVVAIVDGLLTLMMKPPVAVRRLPSRMAVGIESEVELRLVNQSKRHLHFSVYDGVPARSECEIFPWKGWLKGKGYLDLNYPITLHERGAIGFGNTHVLLTSMLGLWSRRHLVGAESEVKVYPNYQPVLSYALMAMAHRQEHTGIIRKNRAGLSRDFHQLRDYQMGDALTQIDWKASSKRQSLISRDFQEQLDQSVILMLDCGRRMRTIDGEISQFDHCLNSMLLLSYVALRQGDQVGILSFGGTDRWLPPVKGSSSMTTVLNLSLIHI